MKVITMESSAYKEMMAQKENGTWIVIKRMKFLIRHVK